MKKILFVIPELSHGGTNKTLENYLSLIDKTKYNISIFCINNGGGNNYYYKRVFKPYSIRRNWIGYIVKENYITRKIFRYLFRHKTLNYTKYKSYEAEVIQKKYNFDVIIAFQEEGATEYVTYFKNVKKIAWLHSFWVKINRIASFSESIKYYESYDSIVCVSDCLKSYFSECYPSLYKRTKCIYNPVNYKEIELLSEKTSVNNIIDDSFFSIISVGHLNRIKNFHLIPLIVEKILKKGKSKPFKWFIIGGEHHPGYKQEIEDIINKLNLNDIIIFLGEIDNPYPYIKAANLLACTSESESFSYVIAEAKVLHTPVISNNFPVAYDVVPNDCGWVIPIEDMPTKLDEIINDNNHEYSRVCTSISHYKYDNAQIINNFNNLIDNL